MTIRRSSTACLPPIGLAILNRTLCVAAGLACAIWLLMFHRAGGQEYSLIRNSTVIGRNYGLPPAIEFSADRTAGDLGLVVESIFFAKNLELTGSPNIDGETFIGTVNPLRFNYLASDDVQLELGAYLGQNYGDDDSLDISEFLARLIYQPLDNQFAIAGSLIQTHWVHDALLDDVQIYRDNVETGLQYRVDLPWLKTDYWLNWRVRETAVRSEQFEGALVNQIRWGRWWMDGQALWAHTGGQKNLMGQVANNSTGMLGLSIGLGPESDQGHRLRIGTRYLASHFESRTVAATSGQGVEYWARYDLPLEGQLFRIFGRHYDGDQFLSVRGDPLYRFDQYSQFGFDWVKPVRNNLELELGFVGQHADDTFMNTYQINFVWQNRFRLTNLCCQPPEFVPAANSEFEGGE